MLKLLPAQTSRSPSLPIGIPWDFYCLTWKSLLLFLGNQNPLDMKEHYSHRQLATRPDEHCSWGTHFPRAAQEGAVTKQLCDVRKNKSGCQSSLGPSPWPLVQLSLTTGGLHWDKFVGAPCSRPGNTTSGSKLQPAHCSRLTGPCPRAVTALQEACSSPPPPVSAATDLISEAQGKDRCTAGPSRRPSAFSHRFSHPSASSLQTLYIRSSLKEK